MPKWGPDSPVPGSRFSPYPSVPKSPFLTLTQFLRNLYFYSALVRIPPIFDKGPKMPKTHLPESLTIRDRFGGGIFVHFFGGGGGGNSSLALLDASNY